MVSPGQISSTAYSYQKTSIKESAPPYPLTKFKEFKLQICFSGRGHVVVDQVRHELVPGSACFLGYDVKHEIVNDGDGELVMMWVISPSGLEDFFQTIGQPRKAGDAAPPPFERPADVVAVERSMGMNDT
jgi:hypothetical protein